MGGKSEKLAKKIISQNMEHLLQNTKERTKRIGQCKMIYGHPYIINTYFDTFFLIIFFFLLNHIIIIIIFLSQGF